MQQSEIAVTKPLIIGPILKRDRGYAFETWSASSGHGISAHYLTYEQTRYDRSHLIRTTRRDGTPSIECEDVASYEAAIVAQECRSAA